MLRVFLKPTALRLWRANVFVASRRCVHAGPSDSANGNGLRPLSDTSPAGSSSQGSSIVRRSPVAPPRRPPSCWRLFVKERFGEVTKKYLAEASPIWRGMSTAEKQPYVDAAVAARAEYVRLRDEYCKVYGLVLPRRPKAHMWRMAKAKGLHICTADIARVWKELPKEEQQPYIDSYNKEAEEYRLARLEFDTQLQRGALSDVFKEKNLNTYRLHQRAIQLVHDVIKHSLTVPHKPPSVPMIFGREHGLDAAKASRKLATMTEEEKKPYRDAHSLAVAKYREEYEGYKRLVAGRVVRGLDGTELETMARSGKPPRPYLKFWSEFVQTCPRDGEGNLCDAAAAKWQAMSDEEKAPYIDTFLNEWEAYKWQQRNSSSPTQV